jgi:hypothetical protein
MTKKLLLAVIAVSLLTVPMALAQVEILVLGDTGAGSFVFTGTGTTTVGSVTGSDWSLAVTNGASGGAFGEGPASGQNGTYSLTTTGVTITGTFQGVVAGADEWTITQNKAIGFNISGGLLSGNLTLVSLDQEGSVGHFNDNLTANLTGLSGALAPYFTSAGGVVTLDIDLSKGNLSTLGTGSTLKEFLADGSVSSTPEPGTFVMLGAGLLGAGGYLRRKIGV